MRVVMLVLAFKVEYRRSPITSRLPANKRMEMPCFETRDTPHNSILFFHASISSQGLGFRTAVITLLSTDKVNMISRIKVYSEVQRRNPNTQMYPTQLLQKKSRNPSGCLGYL